MREGIRYVRIRLVIFALEGEGGTILPSVTFGRVQRDIDFANAAFLACGSGIQFQLCDAPQVVVDPAMYGNPALVSFEQYLSYHEHGSVTIYYTGPTFPAGGASADIARVAQNAPMWVLAHELGHVFGLPHTDGLYGSGIPELVDGSNCAIAGDLICDTPADPGLYLPNMVEPGTCAYIGTVTDANGDSYAPLPLNIMSAAPCLKDSFTPGQGQVMRFMLENVLFQLFHTPDQVLIEPFETTFCTNGPPTPLSASPAPGAFSGPWVQEDLLLHVPAPAGNYHVTYVPDDAPVQGAWPYADVCHAPGVYVGQQVYLPLPGDSVRQSFRAVRNGTFDRIETRLHSGNATTFRMRLYAGTNMDLTLLHDTVAFHPGTDTLWLSFGVADGIPCQADGIYSFVITAEGPFTAFAPTTAYLPWGSNNLGPFQVTFRSWIRTDMPCQQHTRIYSVYEVPARPILNLPAAACSDNDEPIALLVDMEQVTTSVLLMDGEPTTTVVPAWLEPGTHLAQHIYTINGCTDTLDQAFVVATNPSFSFQELADLYCTTDPPVDLLASPDEGVFTIDGAQTDLLDPAALGPGSHTVMHSYIQALDTITFPDQRCCDVIVVLTTELGTDSTAWQSFVPSVSGELAWIDARMLLFDVPRVLLLEMREGIGLGGQVIYSDTVFSTTNTIPLFTNTGLILEAGQAYTWSLTRLADDQQLVPRIGYVFGSLHPEGPGNAPGIETETTIPFTVHLTRTYACETTNVFEVAVEICTGVEDTPAPAFTAWPNPFAEHLWLKSASEALHITVQAADGRLVGSMMLQPGSTGDLDLRHLAPGAYWLRATALDGAVLPGMPLMKVAR